MAAANGAVGGPEAVAAKLLDFSQPLDVALLDSTVNAFYGAGSNQEVREDVGPLALAFRAGWPFALEPTQSHMCWCSVDHTKHLAGRSSVWKRRRQQLPSSTRLLADAGPPCSPAAALGC